MISPRMPLNNDSIIAVPEKNASAVGNMGKDLHEKKPADFETAIAAAGSGKFQFLLLLAVIPAAWAGGMDATSISIILPTIECDLKTTLFQKGVLNAITFVGMVSSGFLWGYVADVRGRRSVVIYGSMADGICNILTGFSQNFWTLASFKFINGVILSGPHAAIVTYCSEFYGIKGRGRIPLFVGFSLIFGTIVAAALGWLVVPQPWSIVIWNGAFVFNSWRIYLSLCGVPTLLGTVFLFLFPESPKFLMSRGRNEEAMKVFKMIYKLNTGRPANEYPILDLADESYHKASSDANLNQKSQKTAIFFYPHLPRILLVTLIQFGTMLATNTIRLWQPELFVILGNFVSQTNATTDQKTTFCDILDFSTNANGNSTTDGTSCAVINESVYMSTVIMYTFTIICILVATLVLKIINQKNLLFVCYGVALFCIVYLNWSSNAMSTLVLMCTFVGLMTTNLNVVVSAAVILFPTSLRTIAVSLVWTAGRLGSIVGSLLFPVLLEYGCLAPLIVLAGFVILSIVLTCFLAAAKKTTTGGSCLRASIHGFDIASIRPEFAQ
ncbi:synaptic vesicle 2-related protein-like [Hylaeus volcanicus]|uniref:synaptic vesicle 2-related protein-like n=1 Tax=Hylaeus volcanicus TaxID=313075 RepID=UPI0023B80050|nr:synaptic vesicle 2-related protein-like [Hylaeus volcanicus]